MSGELWFKPESLNHLTDGRTWSRGMGIFLTHKNVLGLEIERNDDHWVLYGAVQGTQRAPYSVEVNMRLSAAGNVVEWESECDCPVSYQCKHGVALTIAAAHNGLALLGDELPGSQWPLLAENTAAHAAARERMEAIKRIEAENQLLGWLRDMARAGGATVADSSIRTINPFAGKPKNEQYLYLISIVHASSARPRLQMDAMVSHLKVNGGWAKPRAVRYAPYSGQSVYDQATSADHEVLKLISAMPDTHFYAYSSTFSSTPAEPPRKTWRL